MSRYDRARRLWVSAAALVCALGMAGWVIAGPSGGGHALRAGTRPSPRPRRDATGRVESRPAGRSHVPPGTIKLSLADCLGRALRNHPDFVATELPVGEDDRAVPCLALAWATPPKDAPRAAAAREALMRRRVNHVLCETTEAYWALTGALEKQRILEKAARDAKTRAEHAKVRAEGGLVADSAARFVAGIAQERASELSVATEAVHAATDRLKLLMNDPRLQVTSAERVLPTTSPVAHAVRVDLSDQLRLARRNAAPAPDTSSAGADRKRAGRLACAVKAAVRQIRHASDRMRIEARCEKDFAKCAEALRLGEKLIGVRSIAGLNQLSLVEEHLTCARLRLLEARADYNLGLCRLDRASGTLHRSHGLRVKLKP